MRVKAFSIVAAVAISFAGSAIAKDIPSDLLELDFQRCTKDCVPGYGEAACNKLCSCTVDEFQKRLDFSTYLDLSAQLARETLTENNQALLGDIANYCTAELDKSGIKIEAPKQ